jgi:hypothetical protein
MAERAEPLFKNPITGHRVIDGDTADLVLDLGFRIAYRLTMRLNLWDAPEKHHKDPMHKAAGIIVLDATTTWMTLAAQYPLQYWSYEWDGRGRSIGDVKSDTFGFLSDYLVLNRLVRLTGKDGKRPEWLQSELQDIVGNGYKPPIPIL